MNLDSSDDFIFFILVYMKIPLFAQGEVNPTSKHQLVIDFKATSIQNHSGYFMSTKIQLVLDYQIKKFYFFELYRFTLSLLPSLYHTVNIIVLLLTA